ncbi:hypothetical protein CVT24_002584 [Panaeolus cyanescens]|uniref:Uncharacterized protein n=1 Tax=Panaeolus cyanescens TaxID=181874 RepID=A0A409WB66_9AGAR|nr:hypothetical protein CVT24_002584 [Panaeolus cyanescens]
MISATTVIVNSANCGSCTNNAYVSLARPMLRISDVDSIIQLRLQDRRMQVLNSHNQSVVERLPLFPEGAIVGPRLPAPTVTAPTHDGVP